MTAARIAEFRRRGWRCETGRCPEPAVIATVRHYHHEGRVRVMDHFTCEAHGAEFAGRHHIEIEPAPEEAP